MNNENVLRSKYRIGYIAVKDDCGVIDSDINEFNLARRIHQNTHTKKFILIDNIENIINPRNLENPSIDIEVRE